MEATSEKKKIFFDYDPLGRCLHRISYRNSTSGWIEEENEHYLYHNQNEIGAFTSTGKPKNLRILGVIRPRNNSSTIAIELEGQVFAPIIDVQENVRGLVELNTGSISGKYEFTAFGEEVHHISEETHCNPWRFASKRFDPELKLINFGKRFYDPETGRWMTPDPEGFIDSMSLYQYVFNNPFRYQDPDGRFAFVIPLFTIAFDFVLTWTAAEAVVGTVIGASLGWGAYEINKIVDKKSNRSDSIMHQETLPKDEEKKKGKGKHTYAPDRPLPHKQGVHIPDTDAPRTQLGTKDGSKGKYNQAREFDENGKPICDFDFTDHGRPRNHTDPHQHEWNENPTGGSKIRDTNNKPLLGWSYE